MVDWITPIQNLYSRLRSPWLFSFRQEFYTEEGLSPDPLRDRQTHLGKKLGTRWFSRQYPGVPGRIHLHDSMLQNDSREEIEHYIKVGRSAMENIEAALGAAGLSFDRIHACLDMACGYGRVQRWLSQRISAKKITACEVMPEAIQFLHQEFGSKPLLSPHDLSAMRFPQNYDLIWVGSLFTHLVPEHGVQFMETLFRALNPSGLLVFSTQGPSCLEHIPFYGFMFKDKTEEFRRQLETIGAAYLPYYDHAPNYGITLFTPEYIQRKLEATFGGEIRRVRYAERGWDDHQDVYAFHRVAPDPI